MYYMYYYYVMVNNFLTRNSCHHYIILILCSMQYYVYKLNLGRYNMLIYLHFPKYNKTRIMLQLIYKILNIRKRFVMKY